MDVDTESASHAYALAAERVRQYYVWVVANRRRQASVSERRQADVEGARALADARKAAVQAFDSPGDALAHLLEIERSIDVATRADALDDVRRDLEATGHLVNVVSALVADADPLVASIDRRTLDTLDMMARARDNVALRAGRLIGQNDAQRRCLGVCVALAFVCAFVLTTTTSHDFDDDQQPFS